jgi:hypothetical protein
MQKSALIVIVVLLVAVISLSIILLASPNIFNPLQANSPSNNTPSPTPISSSFSSPSPSASPSATQSAILPTVAPTVQPTEISVPVPSFTLTQTIRNDINTHTGNSYESICAKVTIKNEQIVKHFEVQFKGHFGESWIPVTFDLEKTNTEYTSMLSDWLPDGTWDFKVRAYDASGTFEGRSSDWSPMQTITITGN